MNPKIQLREASSRSRSFSISKILIYLFLILWAFTTIFPFVWVINNSFKNTNLVISDSFAPAFQRIYRYDKDGQIVHEKTQLDEVGRTMYDQMLFNEDGTPVYERDLEAATVDSSNPLAALMQMTGAPKPEEVLNAQAYDTKNGKILYDMDSAPVLLTPSLANYENAFTNPNVNILNGYKNSLIISGSVMLAVMLLSTMLAFGVTRYQFRGANAIRSLIVAALMFPAFSTIVPVYRMLADAGLHNTLPGVILVQLAGNLAFATTVMFGFISSLPYELEEAAFMEGAGVYRIFTRIVLPMSKPALATVAIFTFIWSYNDLFVQMVIIRSRALMPVCAILREISSQYGTDFGLMAAAVTIVVIPVLILYIFLQKNIIKGLTAGAVKG